MTSDLHQFVVTGQYTLEMYGIGDKHYLVECG